MYYYFYSINQSHIYESSHYYHIIQYIKNVGLSMSGKNTTMARIHKEEQMLLKSPINKCLVKRKGLFDFHFCFYGLDGEYEGGYYHGFLRLPHNYPFAPPVLKFVTPSGRFEVDKPICTTFTNFHKQTWSSAWTVEKMVLATISFFQTNENTAGAVMASSGQKQKLAKKSLEYNLKNEEFCEIFPLQEFENYRQIVALSEKMKRKQANEQQQHISKQKSVTGNSTFLIVLFLLLTLIYIMHKVGQSKRE